MCGRFVQSNKSRRAAQRITQMRQEAARPETWNLAPSTAALVLRSARQNQLESAWLTWGFRDSPVAPVMPINARVESATAKPLFRDAWKTRRCLVPVDGWYEWRQEQSIKQPYYFTRKDGEPLLFAGIWTGETFALLTTAAEGELTQIHHRRPLALEEKDGPAWLERPPASENDLIGKRVPAEAIAFQPVDPRVNNVRNDDPQLIEAFKIEPKKPELVQLGLF